MPTPRLMVSGSSRDWREVPRYVAISAIDDNRRRLNVGRYLALEKLRQSYATAAIGVMAAWLVTWTLSKLIDQRDRFLRQMKNELQA
jgi:hypothetical protein